MNPLAEFAALANAFDELAALENAFEELAAFANGVDELAAAVNALLPVEAVLANALFEAVKLPKVLFVEFEVVAALTKAFVPVELCSPEKPLLELAANGFPEFCELFCPKAANGLAILEERHLNRC